MIRRWMNGAPNDEYTPTLGELMALDTLEKLEARNEGKAQALFMRAMIQNKRRK